MNIEQSINRLRETGKPDDNVLATLLEQRLKELGDIDTASVPRTLGFKAIANSNRPTTTRLVEQASMDIEATPALNGEIQSMLEDTVLLIKDEMPTYPQERDKKLFGRLNDIGWVDWRGEQTIDDRVFHYFFKLEYIPQKSGNQLKRFSMTFGNKAVTQNRGDYKMSMDFVDDAVAQIYLTNDTYDKLHDDSQLRQLLSKSIPIEITEGKKSPKQGWDTDILGGRHTSKGPEASGGSYTFNHQRIKLSPTTISFSSEGYDNHPVVSREYDPNTNYFRTTYRTGGFDFQGKELIVKTTPVAQGAPMENITVKNVIKAFIDLIPLSDRA